MEHHFERPLREMKHSDFKRDFNKFPVWKARCMLACTNILHELHI